MTVLVTGGTGLVGSRLLKRLASSGVACRALIRAGKEVPDGVTPVEGDVLETETLPRAVQGVEAVIHLAAVFRAADEELIWRVNLQGTQNLIAMMEEHAPGARLLMASTSNVYDADGSHPGREDDEVRPTHAYPASKVAAERELLGSRLNWAVLRLPFVYGDGDGHLETTPQLLADMKRHPAQRFSVVHHEDVATAFVLALSGAMDGRIVNIADESPLAIYEMAQLVGFDYEPSAEPLANPWQGHMDATLARQPGFEPKVSTIYQALREGRL